jgi:hypothetical protein
MKKKAMIVAIAALFILPVSSAFAYDATAASQRIRNQRNRISVAYNEGNLTKWEFKRLNEQQRKIVWKLNMYMRDNAITQQEAATLDEMQTKASARITKLRTNDKARKIPVKKPQIVRR